jgi:hypothetical protein
LKVTTFSFGEIPQGVLTHHPLTPHPLCVIFGIKTLKSFLTNLINLFTNKPSSQETPSGQFSSITLPHRIYLPKENLINEELTPEDTLRYGIQSAIFIDKYGKMNQHTAKIAQKWVSNPGFQSKTDELVNNFKELYQLGLVTTTDTEDGIVLEVMASPYGEQ